MTESKVKEKLEIKHKNEKPTRGILIKHKEEKHEGDEEI